MYRAPRGTFDILPDQQAYWQYIRSKVADICQLYGYERIDTPIFESSGLFVRSIGDDTDIVQKEMYTFDDRGGDQLTLRPEGTAPVCRAYLEHGMYNFPQPVRLYYIGPSFRYERPQAGRYRQHWQFGVEAIGESDASIDAEIIDMAWSLYRSVGLRDLVLKLNSIGCPKCRPQYLEALKNYYSQNFDRLCSDCKRRLDRNPLRILDCKNETCMSLAEQAPRSIDYLCDDCAEHFRLLVRYLEILGLRPEVDHHLVRGLDYYTRTVFEIQPHAEEGAQSTIGGGGRYDGLIEELGGKPTPAIGFATGIERMVVNMKRQGIELPPASRPEAFVAFLGQEAKEKAVECVGWMRGEGIGTILASGNRSLKAQLRQANTFGASFAVIIGEDELRDGLVMLRDMSGGEQRRVTFDEALQALQQSGK